MKVRSVVETAIYVDDLDDAEDFYQRVLGLNVIAREQNRHVFFQVGDSKSKTPRSTSSANTSRP